ELQRHTAIQYPQVLQSKKQMPRVIEIMQLQQQLFASRLHLFHSELAGYQQTLNGLESQQKAVEESLSHKEQQQQSLQQQLANLQKLVAEGYLARNRYLEMQRSLLDI